MALSGGSASMRRFPGLNLLAWVLISGANTIVKGMNVSAVTALSGSQSRIDFTTPMPSANYQIEMVNSAGIRVIAGIMAAASVNIYAREATGTAAVNFTDMTYVAVYA